MGGKKDGAKAQTTQQQSEGKPAGAPVAVAEATAAAPIDSAQTHALVRTDSNTMQLPSVPQHAHAVITFDATRVKLLADTIMPGANESELEFFQLICKRTGLDPFARQIHAMKRRQKVKVQKPNGQTREEWQDRWSFQVAIDGFRLIAERTGKYRGQTVPLFCGDDGVWREVWLSKQAPRACKIGVLRADFDEPLYAVALWDEYVQTKDEYENDQATGRKIPVAMWLKMPSMMLAKVAEALALRKAFPQEMSGLYTDDEMGQADNERDDKAESRASSRTQSGDRAQGSEQQQDDRNFIPGSAPLFPYGPLKEQGFTLDAKYKPDASVTLKGKKGAPDEVVQLGGQYCVKEKRLLEAKDWATKKIRDHHEVEDIPARERTEEQKKATLSQEMYDRFVTLVDDLNAELERRLAEQSAGTAPAQGNEATDASNNETK